MENINAVLNALNSDKTTCLLFEFYDNHKKELSKKWRKPKLFSKYCKAFILDAYLSASEKSKDVILNNYKDGNFNTVVASRIIDDLNAAVAKPGDCIEDLGKDYFEQYADFYDDPLFEKISWDNFYIGEAIRNFCGFYTMEELTSKDVEKKHNYKFTNDELKTLKYASYVPGLITNMHLLYDEQDDETTELHCNYELIEDPLLKKFAFHTSKDNYYFYVLADNRRLIRYHEGDIRVYQLTFDEFIEMVKLYFIKLYREREIDLSDYIDDLTDDSDDDISFGNDDDEEESEDSYDPNSFRNLCETILGFLDNMIDNSKNDEIEIEGYLEETDDQVSPKDYEKYMSKAIEYAWSDIQTVSDVYSLRMITKAREDVQRVRKLILTYKL